MMFQLRDYQKETVRNIYNSVRRGNHTIVVQQPPRTGKTVIMAEIARRATNKNNRVLFIVHRTEIIEQARKTFEKQGVKMQLADFGMIQTLSRHVDTISPPAIIFVDEGHHALAQGYLKVINQFPKAIKLLFTATPHRTGRKQLDIIADDLIVGKSVKWLTEHGNIAPFQYFSINYINNKILKRNATGDYTQESMELALNKKIYGNVVNHFLKITKGTMQAVVYCYSVKNAKVIADKFNERNISAEEVDGSTPLEVRNQIVKRFKNGQTQILTNVNLFTEGVDLPNVDCVVMVRPTASLSLYLQFAMRCLNPRPNKKAIIIDHVGNYLKFGLPDDDRDWEESMHTKKKKKKGGGEPIIRTVQCAFCFATVRLGDLIHQKEKRFCPNCFEEVEVPDDHSQVKTELLEVTETEKARSRLHKVQKMIHNNIIKNVADKKINQLRLYEEFEAYAELNNYSRQWAYVMYNKLIKNKEVPVW